MHLVEPPVRRDVAVDRVPKVSVVNGTLCFEIEANRFTMTPDIASGWTARVADKLAALAKLQE
jgi:hypothetical protein